MKSRIHYHSDCSFFAGCENMLVNFFNSGEFRDGYDISFSYRYSTEYADGFGKRLKKDLPVYPLRYPDLQDFIARFNAFPHTIRRFAVALISALFTLPVLLLQIFALYRLLKRVAPDVLHINNGGYPGAMSSRVASIAGKMAGVPKILMVVNNMAVAYSRWSRRFEYPLTGWLPVQSTCSLPVHRRLLDSCLKFSRSRRQSSSRSTTGFPYVRQPRPLAKYAAGLGWKRLMGSFLGLSPCLFPEKATGCCWKRSRPSLTIRVGRACR